MDAPAPTIDYRFEKAVAFTETEVVVLEAWKDAADGGEYELAHKVLRAGLLAEHYKSLLAENPGQITDHESAVLAELLNQLRELLDRVGRFTHKTYGL